jgi:hypothetical protein
MRLAGRKSSTSKVPTQQTAKFLADAANRYGIDIQVPVATRAQLCSLRIPAEVVWCCDIRFGHGHLPLKVRVQNPGTTPISPVSFLKYDGPRGHDLRWRWILAKGEIYVPKQQLLPAFRVPARG